MPTLTPSLLTESMVLAEKMFADSNKKKDYVAEVNAANAIIENTTADMKIITDTNKIRTATIVWNKFCNTTVATSAPDYCSFTGTEADSLAKSYIIDTNANKTFTIDEGNYQTNMLDFAAVYADNLLKVMKYMDEKIASTVVSKVDSFTSANLYQVTGIGCPATGPSWASTYIQPALWSPDIMGYFLTVARINKFSSPFLLDGKNLYNHFWKAVMNAGNADGKGAKTMFDQMKYYEDLVNVEAVSAGKTFMIERGTVAFASKAQWDSFSESNPKKGAGDLYKYSVPSKNIKGLKYDVYVKETCSGKFSKYDVLVDCNYGVYNGASSCDSATGVLEFICGNCP